MCFTAVTRLSAAPFSDSQWSNIGGLDQPSYEEVEAMVVDSQGRLYVGGVFSSMGGVAVTNIARWNGTTWEALGSGVPGAVTDMATDGTFIYVAGQGGLRRWDGNGWTVIGRTNFTGPTGSVERVIVNGDVVYAFAGMTDRLEYEYSTPRVGRWTAAAGWSILGTLEFNDGVIYDMTLHGTDLYVVGAFMSVNGVAASRVARWDGLVWSPVGSGVDALAKAIVSHEGALYVGGQFSLAGGQPASRIARWDGSTWSALGSGIASTQFGSAAEVWSLASTPTGLLVGGNITHAGGVPANGIANWNGSNWQALGSGLQGRVKSLAVASTTLYAGGPIGLAGTIDVSEVARADISTGLGAPVAPSMTTATVIDVTTNSATAGGDVTDDGGATVTERGVVYSTTTTPTTDTGTKVTSGSGTGSFTGSLTGLSPDTTYYVRAYAINSVNTAYGSEVSFQTSAPALTVVQTPRPFPATLIGKESRPQYLLISNSGGTTLNGLNVALGGSGRRDFSLVQPVLKSLTPGASTTFKVTFRPRAGASSLRKAALTVSSSAPSVNLALSGRVK
jgi:hypothetical protein